MLSMGLKSSIRGDKGFTLIEIIISMAIFATMILAVTQLTFTNIKRGTNVDYFNQAIALGDAKMENLKKSAQNEPFSTNTLSGYDWFISKGSNFRGQGFPGQLAAVASTQEYVMWDNGAAAYGDKTANDATFTRTDWINLDSMEVATFDKWPTGGRYIRRVWTITPVTQGNPPPAPTTSLFDALIGTTVDNNNGTCALDNVMVVVTTYWTDMSNKLHWVTLKSYIPRRQTL